MPAAPASPPRDQVHLIGRRGGGEIDVHTVLHRLGFRNGNDIDADGDGVRPDEAHGFNVGHARSLAGNTPAERLRPEPADRRVIPSFHIHLNKSQRHAAKPYAQVVECNEPASGAIHHFHGR